MNESKFGSSTCDKNANKVAAEIVKLFNFHNTECSKCKKKYKHLILGHGFRTFVDILLILQQIFGALGTSFEACRMSRRSNQR